MEIWNITPKMLSHQQGTVSLRWVTHVSSAAAADIQSVILVHERMTADVNAIASVIVIKLLPNFWLQETRSPLLSRHTVDRWKLINVNSS
jgi:hypothetical protein